MLSACIARLCLNRFATLSPNGRVLVLQVVKWANGLAAVAQAPSQEAVIIGVFQFCDQVLCRNSFTQQSPLNNVREVAQGLQVTGGQGFAPIQFEHFNGCRAFCRPIIQLQIKTRADIAGDGIEVQVFPRVLTRGVYQQRLLARHWKFITFEPPALGATQQEVRPEVHALWIDGFRTEVLDVSTVRVQAVHAALPWPHHGLQRGHYGFEWLGLPGAFPVALNSQIAIFMFCIGGGLPFDQVALDHLGQGGPLDAPHDSHFLVSDRKQLELFGLNLLILAELGTCTLFCHQLGVFRTPLHSPGRARVLQPKRCC